MSINLEVLLSVIACSAATLCLFASIVDLIEKQRAEREFQKVLCNETAARHLRELRSRFMEDGVVSEAELHSLIASLEKLTHELSKKHKLLIERGLHQRSILGRARYVAKVMNKAGIGAGPLPIPMA